MRYILIFICFFFPFHGQASTFKNDEGCSSKLLQTTKVSPSNSSRQGYGIITFDIMPDGRASNIKTIDSQCAISRNEDGSILFKKCPFFKKSSYASGRYLKFSKPKNIDGSSCMLADQQYIFSYHKYRVKFDDPKQFLLSDDIARRNDRSETSRGSDSTPVYPFPIEYPDAPAPSSPPELPNPPDLP